jgi:hypothetical protein
MIDKRMKIQKDFFSNTHRSSREDPTATNFMIRRKSKKKVSPQINPRDLIYIQE